ncbi:MAG: flagellar export chaperone FlgN [Gemmatimonadetes bacterium]|nr:flagellar export chaperone FlgN [Gemmatimonadota bacterium]
MRPGALAQAPAAADVLALQSALDTEMRLLGDLADVLGRQRRGVAADDIEAVDDSVFAAHRVLRTLEEARRRRRALLAILTGDEDTPLESLEDALGDDADAALLRARDALLETARSLSRQIELNRRVLRQALANGENRMRSLCGVASAPVAYDGAAATRDRTATGVLLNRKV